MTERKIIRKLRRNILRLELKINNLKTNKEYKQFKNLRESKIISLVDEIDFLESIFCGEKENIIRISYTGRYRKTPKCRAYEHSQTAIIIPCQDMSIKELKKFYKEEQDHPIPFISLFLSIINATNMYEISRQPQVIVM